MRRCTTLLRLVALAAIAAGCTATTLEREPATSTQIVAEGVTYALGREADVFIPVPLPAEALPIVVLLHGCCGDRADLVKLAEATAAEGVAVVNVSWGGYATNASFPESYEDVACAMRFARGQAEQFGADPDRVALVGWEDGALTGSVIALAGDEFSAERCAHKGHSALPDAFVGVNGFYGWTLPVDPAYVTDRAARFFDGTPDEQPAAWHDATPYAWLGRRPAMPSVLLVGATDPLHVDAVRYDRALRSAGQPSRLLVLPEAGDQSLTSARTEEGRVVAREAAAAAHGAG